MTHTPGPWRVEDVGCLVDSDHRLLANVHLPLREPLSTQDANARLIAAAPDLLAACEYLMKCVEECHWGLVTDEEIELVEMAVAAIKKARGES